jgi:hypothetical protein
MHGAFALSAIVNHCRAMYFQCCMPTPLYTTPVGSLAAIAGKTCVR